MQGPRDEELGAAGDSGKRSGELPAEASSERPPSQASASTSPRSVEGILAEHLARSGTWELDLDALAEEDPEREQELREVGAIMGAVLDAFRDMGDAELPGEPGYVGEAGPEPAAPQLTEALDDAAPTLVPKGAPGDTLPIGEHMPSQLFLRRLAVHRPVHSRYQVKGELGRGGMGTVLRVHDRDLLRTLAMKVAHGDTRTAGRSHPSSVRILERFLNEAQITGQLEHPGIVPIHELGLDEQGRVFFTMPLVKGQDLHAVFEDMAAGRGEWTRERLLEVLVKVCDAVGFAHRRGVLHRDLKPSNIMVGRSGEVYVVDWGLARVMGSSDCHDIRLSGEPPQKPAAGTPETAGSVNVGQRFEGSDREPLRTMDGEILGTPAYMSPEQARGDIESMGPPSDVYAVGAILYELLSGAPPFVETGDSNGPRRIWSRVLAGEPDPLDRMEPKPPAELVAICERAMARDMPRRYPDTAAMAADLRAHLEGRVVAAHRTGALPELTKWFQRNRSVASLVAVLLLALLGSLGAVAFVQGERARESREAARRMALISGVDRARVLLEEARQPWSRNAVAAEDLQSWLERSAQWRSECEALLGPDPAPASEGGGEAMGPLLLASRVGDFAGLLALEELDADLREPLEAELAVLNSILDWERFRHASRPEGFVQREQEGDEIEQAVASIRRALTLIGDSNGGWTQALSTARAEVLRAQATLEDPGWEPLLAELAAGTEPYAPLVWQAQPGLVPLGRDPQSGLFEFHHVLSGAAPERDVSGQWEIEPETGLVLVLIPGGAGHVGAGWNPQDPNYDSEARNQLQWGPPVAAQVGPFLISKYELTQDQWLRMTGARPSELCVGWQYQGGPMIRGDHPVEQVSWEEGMEVLQSHGLTLPTEAQWEWAARGQVEFPQWFAFRPSQGFSPTELAEWCSSTGLPGQDDLDGWPGHAPVDSFEPNPYGLYNVIGNVYEWCRDAFVVDLASASVHPESALLEGGLVLGMHRAYRGGGWRSTLNQLRASARFQKFATSADYDLGLRPSLDISAQSP